jgi:multidrug resistance efflux pump
MNRKAIITSVAVLASVGAALGFYWPFGKQEKTLLLPGVVEIQEVRLGSKVGGRVLKVFVREGEQVKAGQQLVQLDIAELKAQREQQQAKLQSALANLEKARNGPRAEEVQQAEGDLASDKADLQQARQEFERIKKGYPKAFSQADYDNARAAVQRSEGRVQSTSARLKMLKDGTRPEDIADAEAQVAQMRARLSELDVQVKEEFVIAPEAAIVEVVAVRAGDLVAANQPVLRVLRADDLWVKVYVPETQLGKVRLNQTVAVTMDSYPDRRFEGTVIQVASASEYTPRNVQSADERRHQVFAVKVRVADPKGVFKSGMAAEVVIPLQD